MEENKSKNTLLEVNEALGIEKDADPVAAAKNLKASVDQAEKDRVDRERKEFTAAIDEVIDTAKKDGKLLPAHEAGIRAMVDGWVKTTDDDGKMSFTSGKETKKGTVVEALTAHFAAMSRVVNFSESGETTIESSASDSVIPAMLARNLGTTEVPRVVVGAEQDAEVRAYAKENEVDYIEAFCKLHDVVINDPDPEANLATVLE